MTARSTLHVVGAELKRNPGSLLFPIPALAKRPPCFEGYREWATNDIAKLSLAHAKYRAPNWGIALARSRLIVMDVDRKAGKHGQGTLDALEAKHGPLPPTFTVLTPSGGLHLYFRETAEVRHRFALGIHGFGLDIDSTHYVIAAGCHLAGGGMYRVISNAPIANAPDWFGEYLVERQADQSDAEQIPEIELDAPGNITWAVDFLQHDAAPSVEGQNGEFTLLMVAGELKDHGIAQDTAIDLLAAHYNDRCSPPWSVGDGAVQDRLDVKVANAWRYLRKNRPGARTPQADFANDPPPTAAELARIAAHWQRPAEPEQQVSDHRRRKLRARDRRRQAKEFAS